MATSFGEQLRLAREARGVTLRQISDHTRISIRYLEAIETNDYKRLPGGIFNRSFIKAYAREIGFDEKEAVEGYLRTAREHGEPDEVATTPYKSHVYTDGDARSPLITLLLSALILAVLSLGAYAAYHWYQRREAAKSANTQQPANAQAAQQSPSQAPQTGATQAPANPNANGFHVEVAVKDKNVWIRTKADESSKKEFILKPGNPPEKFDPSERLVINYAAVNADAIEVTINGRRARVPSDKAEMVITKEGYEQLLLP